MRSRLLADLWRSRPSVPGLLALLAAAATGFAFAALHVPLAWILGPMLATAVAALSGVRVFAPLAGRRLGQVAIGTSIGLNITAAVALLMLDWLPVMVVTALVGILVAAVLSVPYARLARLDGQTAYYAMMPGGLSEMANLAAAVGAKPEPIAVAQALRVALLVLTLPPFIVALDIHGSDLSAGSLPVLDTAHTLLALTIGLLGVVAARLVRLKNPWMIGAMVGVGVATAAGLLGGRLPLPLYWFGQFLVGISIGARFRREIVLRLPRVVAASTFFVLLMASVLFGYAAIVSATGGIDLATATLGASPGGLAEMAITAQALHLSVGLVTGFHAVRAFIVNAFAIHMHRLLERAGLFSVLTAVFGRPPLAK